MCSSMAGGKRNMGSKGTKKTCQGKIFPKSRQFFFNDGNSIIICSNSSAWKKMKTFLFFLIFVKLVFPSHATFIDETKTFPKRSPSKWHNIDPNMFVVQYPQENPSIYEGRLNKRSALLALQNILDAMACVSSFYHFPSVFDQFSPKARIPNRAENQKLLMHFEKLVRDHVKEIMVHINGKKEEEFVKSPGLESHLKSVFDGFFDPATAHLDQIRTYSSLISHSVMQGMFSPKNILGGIEAAALMGTYNHFLLGEEMAHFSFAYEDELKGIIRSYESTYMLMDDIYILNGFAKIYTHGYYGYEKDQEKANLLWAQGLEVISSLFNLRATSFQTQRKIQSIDVYLKCRGYTQTLATASFFADPNNPHNNPIISKSIYHLFYDRLTHLFSHFRSVEYRFDLDDILYSYEFTHHIKNNVPGTEDFRPFLDDIYQGFASLGHQEAQEKLWPTDVTTYFLGKDVF